MRLHDLAKVLRFYQATASIENINITGLQMDSNQVEDGNMFICINGFTVDGHAFAKDAETKGAAAIIAERDVDVSVPVIIVNDTIRALALLANKYYNNPSSHLNLIGVTGTNGKTTVTYLLDHIFRQENKTTGVIGTIQMKMGNDQYSVKNTTPDALFLQKSFRQMIDRNIEDVIMEVSSHALDLGRVYGCDYDIAIFTNLSQDHLDYHKSMNEYLRAKSLLFSQLGNKYSCEAPKYAVINQDDGYSSVFKKSTSQPVITYGIESEADVKAENINLSAHGSQFTLKTNVSSTKIHSKLVGKFSIYNMLAATAGALCRGVSLTTIKKALETTDGVRGRFEPVLLNQPFGVIVDYAHTPDSLQNVLTTIQSFAKGRVYVVIGCGGDRDKKKRPLMASVAISNTDLAIFTSDNPRSENPSEIVKDMITGIDGNNYQIILNRKEAIDHAIDLAHDDDIVLIAGKGHETYQVLGDKVVEFDDREEAAKAIVKKVGKEK
ncbi:UDP-N-acetylmuramoyl-L-alanyl-D-glutamate--2,6-diaminopimelate ligase [Aquibacillus sediminis]|uniref:UDP-N-acetylmuramoyl-L-alanyl-D-glutamate--2, 6-diaminopimelate ligase n=1 Tax=Aquibacillus sediminis TaxID=2574734 RepID=UPI001107BA23|nr:UDP-N-acetylmuramoyl-L-alanyl-D-glutamate--2,6-diaminopimelate ligase [Aquibacillus sediminis]